MKANPTIFQRINWMLSAGIIFRVLSAVATLALTWFLTPEKYAEYSFALSLSLLTVLIASAGLPDYIVSQVKFGEGQLPTLIWRSWGLALGLGGVCVTLMLLSVSRQTMTVDGRWAVFLIGLAAILSSQNFISQAALRSVHQVAVQAQLMLLTGFTSTVALMVAAWQWGETLAVIGATYFVVFLLLFGGHYWVLVRYRLMPLSAATVAMKVGNYTLLRRTLPYGLIPILEMALPVLASYMVITTFTAQIAGSFNLMITLLLSAMTIAIVLDQTFYPVLVSKDEGHIAPTFAGYLLFSLFTVWPAFLIFWQYSEPLANLFLFEKYVGLVNYIYWLAFIVPLHFLAKVGSLYFRLIDDQRLSIAAYVIALLWMVGRSQLMEGLTAVTVARILMEGELLIVLLLITAVLHFAATRQLAIGVLKLFLLALLVAGLALWLPSTLASLVGCLLLYGVGAWVLQLHRDLLRLAQ